MKNTWITFRSVTPAQRGETVLRRNGLSCILRRTPRWMQEKGCGYSLQIRTINTEVCIRLFRENNIEFKKVYLIRDNGSAEEMTL
ncbi:MAG: DUF3343 domain-containing protein [Oscillospiraceae bacterium]|nr:DUF3343 domain-containing protein [Oscillospiraceae bacterium]